MNENEKRAGWRVRNTLKLMSALFAGCVIMSFYSTAKGFSTVFFPKAFGLALAASLVVQSVEALFAGTINFAWLCAFVLSVAFSGMQYIDAANGTAVWMKTRNASLLSTYSTELLPDLQTAVSGELAVLRTSVFDELAALRASVKDEQTLADLIDTSRIEARYEKAFKGTDYQSQPAYAALNDVLAAIAQNDRAQTESLIDKTLNNDVLTKDTIAVMVRNDLAYIRDRMAANDESAANALNDTAHELQTLLLRGQAGQDTLSDLCTQLTEAAMKDDSGVDLAKLSVLKNELAAYQDLLAFSTGLQERVVGQTALTDDLENTMSSMETEAA